MRNLTKDALFRLAFVGFFSYWLFWWLIEAAVYALGIELTTYDIMTELASGLVLGLAPVVAYSWLSSAVKALKEGREGYHYLNFAIFVIAMGLTYQRIWGSLLRWFERPEWMLSSSLSPLAPWTLFFGLVFLITAPGTTENLIPNRNWLLLLAAILIGVAVSSVTVGFLLGQNLPQMDY